MATSTEAAANTLYEGLFLYDPAQVGSSVKTAIEQTEKILTHCGAQIEAVSKWDDRKLAYEIGKTKRGIYILAYFRAGGTKIAAIERDVNLSEIVLRVLMVKAEHIGETELQLAREQAEQSKQAAALEGDESAKKPAPAAATPVAAAAGATSDSDDTDSE